MTLYCALVHHPVRNRGGELSTTAVTTLDVHDIARTARTYGLRGYFVITPVEPQQALVERLLAHWREGGGASRMPERQRALSICRLVPDLQAAIDSIVADTGETPALWATAAAPGITRARHDYAAAREALAQAQGPVLLLFGTGHGLMDATLETAEVLLDPIHGAGDYNHLSVRAAAAITIDRLAGPR